MTEDESKTAPRSTRVAENDRARADVPRRCATACFPFIKSMGQTGDADERSTYTHHMKDALFMMPTARVLANVFDQLDDIDMADRDTKGDLYEYMLGKILAWRRSIPPHRIGDSSPAHSSRRLHDPGRGYVLYPGHQRGSCGHKFDISMRCATLQQVGDQGVQTGKNASCYYKNGWSQTHQRA